MALVAHPGKGPRVDRFIARENLKHFRDRLRCEVDPATRTTLHRLLVAEEDKLSADLGLVDDLEREISKCDAMIERQQALVAGIEVNGGDGAVARTLLEAIVEAKSFTSAISTASYNSDRRVQGAGSLPLVQLTNGFCRHSRQWVGCTLTHCLFAGLIHPPGTRRHGNTSACSPSKSRTASSRSSSNGAVAIGCHMMAS
jgi:hypothetical protein